MHCGEFGKRVISILGEVNGCVGGFLSEDNLPFDLMGSVFDTNQLRSGSVPGKVMLYEHMCVEARCKVWV